MRGGPRDPFTVKGDAGRLYQLLLKDTRAVSGVWCAENGITPKNTLSDGYSPFMPSKAKWIVYSDESDARYLIVSSGIYHRFFAEPARYRERVDLYNRIFALPLVKSFAPMERPDAVLWELENAAAQLRYLKRIAAAGDLAYSGPKISVYENRPR